jgi:transcriptional regulator with XRE-family HTH domain
MLADMPTQKSPSSAFGAGLIAARKARGITQVQLAEALGTTQRMVSYYEAEGGNPPLETVIAIARALKTTPDQLLGFRSPDEPAATAEERRLWRRFRQTRALPEKDQRAIFRMLDTMAKVTPGRAEKAR